METANFGFVQFTQEANFSGAQFTKEALFSEAKFTASPRLNFTSVRIDNQEHFVLPINDLSQVTFANTDISRVRFGVDAVWGDKSKIRDEREIESQLKTNDVAKGIKLGDILSVYRNLRDNYEFNMRYTEAGKFFVREMEINRLYRTISSHSWKNVFRLKWRIKEIRLLELNNTTLLAQNDWINRNLSLTGLYYHLSRYGESFSRPALFGIGIVLFSTLLWLTQPNPAADFSIYDISIPKFLRFPYQRFL